MNDKINYNYIVIIKMRKLKRAKLSAHHGCCSKPNNLILTLDLLERHPEIDMVEIDFICHHQNYISAHDYDDDTINHGSTLEEWVKYMMVCKKILWIDLKDHPISLISSTLSKLDIDILNQKLQSLLNQYPDMREYVIVSCQYRHINLSNCPCLVIRDLPWDRYYLIKAVVPDIFINQMMESQMTELIDECDTDAIALDASYFSYLQLQRFLNHLSAKIVILYNYNPLDGVLNHSHLIIQSDYM
jgi:hypothetical protein